MTITDEQLAAWENLCEVTRDEEFDERDTWVFDHFQPAYRDLFLRSRTAMPALLAEVRRLREELGHATANDGDWLSKTSRAMCETVLGERGALRDKVRTLTAERDAARAECEAMRTAISACYLVESDGNVVCRAMNANGLDRWRKDRP